MESKDNKLSSKSSFRRSKSIEDTKPARDAAKQSAAQLESLNDISDTVHTTGLATSDTIEDTSSTTHELLDESNSELSQINQGLQALGHQGQANLALGMVTAKNSETLTAVASQISERLATLSSKLEEKFNANAELQEVNQKEPEVTSEVLADHLDKQNQNSTTGTSDPAVKALPEHKTTKLVDANEDKGKSRDGALKSIVSSGFASVKGALTKGFSKSVSVADKISSMLFKYTITAAVEAAKIGAVLFALILGIDLIRIHFEYWSGLFKKNFEEFTARLGQWSPIFDGIFTAIEAIRNAWESGDWGALALAVADGLATLFINLGATILLGIGKLSAKILRAMGFSEKGDEIEAQAIQTYQQSTDAALDKDDQQKLAEYQSKRIDEGKTASEGGFFSFLTPEERKKLHLLSDDEYNQIKAEQKDADPLKKMSKEERIEAIKSMNETDAALRRMENHTDALDPNKPNDVKRINQSYDDIKKRLDDPNLAKTPEVKAELSNRLEKIKKGFDNKGKVVKAEKLDDSKDVKAAKNIEKAEATKKAEQSAMIPYRDVNKAQATINNTIVKSSRTVNVQSPVTSTTAPGVHNATRVN